MSSSTSTVSLLSKLTQEISDRAVSLAELIPIAVNDKDIETIQNLLSTLNSIRRILHAAIQRLSDSNADAVSQGDADAGSGGNENVVFEKVLAYILKHMLMGHISRLCRCMTEIELLYPPALQANAPAEIQAQQSGQSEASNDNGDDRAFIELCFISQKLLATKNLLNSLDAVLPIKFVDYSYNEALDQAKSKISFSERIDTNVDLSRLKRMIDFRTFAGLGEHEHENNEEQKLYVPEEWEKIYVRMSALPQSKLWEMFNRFLLSSQRSGIPTSEGSEGDGDTVIASATATAGIPPIETQITLVIRAVPKDEPVLESRVSLSDSNTVRKGKTKTSALESLSSVIKIINNINRRPEANVAVGIAAENVSAKIDEGEGEGVAEADEQQQNSSSSVDIVADRKVDSHSHTNDDDAVSYALRLAGINPDEDDNTLADLESPSPFGDGIELKGKGKGKDGKYNDNDDFVMVDLDPVNARASVHVPIRCTLHYVHELPFAHNTDTGADTDSEAVKSLECDVIIYVSGTNLLNVNAKKAGEKERTFVNDEFLCQMVAVESGTVVISVMLREAPTHKYPSQINDVHMVYQWIVNHAHRQLGIKPRTVSIAASGCGASVATACIAKIIEDSDSGSLLIPSSLILLSPVLDAGSTATSSRLKFLAETGHPSRIPGLYRSCMLPPHAISEPKHYKMFPINMPDDVLRRFPATSIMVGSEDAMKDDGIIFAERLRDLGVDILPYTILNGVGFGIWEYAQFFAPEMKKIVKEIIRKSILCTSK